MFSFNTALLQHVLLCGSTNTVSSPGRRLRGDGTWWWQKSRLSFARFIKAQWVSKPDTHLLCCSESIAAGTDVDMVKPCGLGTIASSCWGYGVYFNGPVLAWAVSPFFICSSQVLVWHSIHVGAETQPSPFPPYLSYFFHLDQFAPTSSWAHFVASQRLDWHRGFGGRVLGLGASCAIRHLISMNLDVSFFNELLAIPSPGRRLFYLVEECNWLAVGQMSVKTVTQ